MNGGDAAGREGYLQANWFIGIMLTVVFALIAYGWSATIFPLVNRVIRLEQWQFEHEKESGQQREKIDRLERDVERMRDTH